jgi:hypothetical protein
VKLANASDFTAWWLTSDMARRVERSASACWCMVVDGSMDGLLRMPVNSRIVIDAEPFRQSNLSYLMLFHSKFRLFHGFVFWLRETEGSTNGRRVTYSAVQATNRELKR